MSLRAAISPGCGQSVPPHRASASPAVDPCRRRPGGALRLTRRRGRRWTSSTAGGRMWDPARGCRGAVSLAGSDALAYRRGARISGGWRGTGKRAGSARAVRGSGSASAVAAGRCRPSISGRFVRRGTDGGGAARGRFHPPESGPRPEWSPGPSPQQTAQTGTVGFPPIPRMGLVFSGRPDAGPSPRSLWRVQCSRVSAACLPAGHRREGAPAGGGTDPGIRPGRVGVSSSVRRPVCGRPFH